MHLSGGEFQALALRQPDKRQMSSIFGTYIEHFVNAICFFVVGCEAPVCLWM
jgi:hypothetical protein